MELGGKRPALSGKSINPYFIGSSIYICRLPRACYCACRSLSKKRSHPTGENLHEGWNSPRGEVLAAARARARWSSLTSSRFRARRGPRAAEGPGHRGRAGTGARRALHLAWAPRWSNGGCRRNSLPQYQVAALVLEAARTNRLSSVPSLPLGRDAAQDRVPIENRRA